MFMKMSPHLPGRAVTAEVQAADVEAPDWEISWFVHPVSKCFLGTNCFPEFRDTAEQDLAEAGEVSKGQIVQGF